MQAAVEAVLMAAEGRGPVLHATTGVGRVLNSHSGINFRNRPGGPDGKRHNR